MHSINARYGFCCSLTGVDKHSGSEPTSTWSVLEEQIAKAIMASGVGVGTILLALHAPSPLLRLVRCEAQKQ